MAEQTAVPSPVHAEASSPSTESSLSWCLVQLTKSPPSESKPSKEVDKRLKASQWKALVAIRTHHIKGGSGRIAWYKTQGGVPPLLAILRRPDSSRKVLDLSLSILANCCTDKETRAEVNNLNQSAFLIFTVYKYINISNIYFAGEEAGWRLHCG